MASAIAKLASRMGPTLNKVARQADTITAVANAVEAPKDVMQPSRVVIQESSSSGIAISTYLLFADIVFLLIGVILLVASNAKCAQDPDGSDCKNHRNWGIAFTVIFSVFFFIILFFKFSG